MRGGPLGQLQTVIIPRRRKSSRENRPLVLDNTFAGCERTR